MITRRMGKGAALALFSSCLSPLSPRVDISPTVNMDDDEEPRATTGGAIRHKDISRNISDFLWRTLHQSQRVGRYWRHIPNYEQRSMCELCDEEESMDHILTECNSPERRLIWGMAESAWRKKHHTWPEPHLGNIIGAPLAQF